MITSKTRTLAGVLLRSGSTYREVADALEISVGSVHNISREGMEYLEPLVTEMKRRSAYRCYLLAEHTLSRMSDGDFDDSGLPESEEVEDHEVREAQKVRMQRMRMVFMEA